MTIRGVYCDKRWKRGAPSLCGGLAYLVIVHLGPDQGQFAHHVPHEVGLPLALLVSGPMCCHHAENSGFTQAWYYRACVIHVRLQTPVVRINKLRGYLINTHRYEPITVVVLLVSG